MKTRLGVMILVFLMGLILGAMQPAALFAAEGGGNIWDEFVDPKPYPGIWFEGPLSIYYEYQYDESFNPVICEDTGDPMTKMFYTVRLNRVTWFNWRDDVKLYTFQGFPTPTCLNDWLFQGNEIRNFLESVVIPGIFQEGFYSWKLKSIKKAQFHEDEFGISRAFVADIEIAVMPKRKWSY
jgi:hypothetical protein